MLRHYINENFIGEYNEIEKTWSLITIDEIIEWNKEQGRDYIEFLTRKHKRGIFTFRDLKERGKKLQELVIIVEVPYL